MKTLIRSLKEVLLNILAINNTFKKIRKKKFYLMNKDKKAFQMGLHDSRSFRSVTTL